MTPPKRTEIDNLSDSDPIPEDRLIDQGRRLSLDALKFLQDNNFEGLGYLEGQIPLLNDQVNNVKANLVTGELDYTHRVIGADWPLQIRLRGRGDEKVEVSIANGNVEFNLYHPARFFEIIVFPDDPNLLLHFYRLKPQREIRRPLENANSWAIRILGVAIEEQLAKQAKEMVEKLDLIVYRAWWDVPHAELNIILDPKVTNLPNVYKYYQRDTSDLLVRKANVFTPDDIPSAKFLRPML